MIIAIDFDGTIAEHGEHEWDVGPEIPGALDTICLLREAGHTLILWTCRGDVQGEEHAWLQVAIDWLKERGIVFDKVNENVHSLIGDPRGVGYWPRKVFAHTYIDDKAVGGFVGWEAVRRHFKIGEWAETPEKGI